MHYMAVLGISVREIKELKVLFEKWKILCSLQTQIQYI